MCCVRYANLTPAQACPGPDPGAEETKIGEMQLNSNSPRLSMRQQGLYEATLLWFFVVNG